MLKCGAEVVMACIFFSSVFRFVGLCTELVCTKLLSLYQAFKLKSPTLSFAWIRLKLNAFKNTFFPLNSINKRFELEHFPEHLHFRLLKILGAWRGPKVIPLRLCLECAKLPPWSGLGSLAPLVCPRCDMEARVKGQLNLLSNSTLRALDWTVKSLYPPIFAF